MKYRNIITFFCLFVLTFFVYGLLSFHRNPGFDHFKQMSRSLLKGNLYLPDSARNYQDTVIYNEKAYMPFPVVPAIILIPFQNNFIDLNQQQMGIIIGSLNTALLFLLLLKNASYKKSLLISLFYAFGTVAFWSTNIGTVWNYALIVSVFFLLLSLISHFHKKHFLSGLFLALAAFSRYPVLCAGLFYVLELLKDKKNFVKFLWGVSFFVPIFISYNYLRFGKPFETGYFNVYQYYIQNGFQTNFLQHLDLKFGNLNYLDIRNIPLHLFTFFFMPPEITRELLIRPSPFGMGIIFTSPLLLLAFIPPFNSFQKKILVGFSAIALIDFLHYSQGWVQFGYRFALDFLPFLLILLSLKIKINKLSIILLIISMLVCVWGTYYDFRFGLL